ncbi:MAG: hypothetical protein CMP48_12020 [Rickettsiales bacterium]|nr:hypothetical protein [Rickettsiales bacterium]
MSEENNHIEQFFKKHLEVEQASFMEEDWAKMEAKLDAAGLGASGTKSGGIGIRKGLVILLLATSIAFILGWFLKDYGQEPDNLGKKGIEENTLIESSSGNEIEIRNDTISESSEQLLFEKKTEETNQSAITTESQVAHNSIVSSDVANATEKPVSPAIEANLIGTTQASETTSKQDRKMADSNTKLMTQSVSKKEIKEAIETEPFDIETSSEQESLYQSTKRDNQTFLPTGTDSEITATDQLAKEYESITVSDDKQVLSIESFEEDASKLNNAEKSYVPLHSVVKISGDSVKAYQEAYSVVPDSLSAVRRMIICPTAPKLFLWKNFAIGLSYAPDFNSLNFKGKLKATNKVGLRLLWKPLKRFELHSGIFFNEKKYYLSRR